MGGTGDSLRNPARPALYYFGAIPGARRCRSARHLTAAILALLLVSISACRGQTKGTVTGTVRYRGESVPAGQVVFYGPDDQSAIAPINEDGSYKATNVPLGEVRVAVITPVSAAGLEKLAKQQKKRFEKGNPLPQSIKTVEVPKRYSDPGQSGLSLTVHEGSQPFNIDIN